MCTVCGSFGLAALCLAVGVCTPLRFHKCVLLLGGKEKIDSDSAIKGKLANIMSYHAIQPLPYYEAWTTPFLNPGTKLTSFGNHTLEVTSGGDGGNVKIQGAGSSAEIQKKDLYACKVCGCGPCHEMLCRVG